MAGNRDFRVPGLRSLGVALIASVVAGAGMALPAPAVTGGGPVNADWARQLVRIQVGEQKACSGALVAPQWVVTAASCFTPAGGTDEVRTGAAPAGTTATVGRPDRSADDGSVRDVDWVVPHPDQDVALARLTLSVDIAPWPVADAPASAGEELAISGFGRTQDVWSPDELQAAAMAASEVSAASFVLSAPAESTAGACDGDAGAPVTRSVDGAVQVVGVLVGSAKDGCLVPASDGDRSARAARADVLADWIDRNAVWFGPDFANSYHSTDGADADTFPDGIGGFNLADVNDQMVAVDYEGTGKLDHLLIYRPGSQKKYWVVKRQADGTFQQVFMNGDRGIGPVPTGGTVLLGDARDKVFAFDCHRSGRQDCIVVYRPGLVAADSESGSYSVFERDPDGGYERIFRHKLIRLNGASTQMLAVDDEGSGVGQHLVFYRPGSGLVTIRTWVFDDDAGTWGTGPDRYTTDSAGIAGFDFRQARDRMIAFDCDRSGREDCLVAYRPGNVSSDTESSSYRVIESAGNGTYRSVFRHRLLRLSSTADQLIAYDHDGSGLQDHLVFYRPGGSWVTVLPWQRNADGSGTAGPAVYQNETTGIGGYDMRSARDRLIAYDNDHRGSPTDLVAYRPGSRIAWVVGRRTVTGDAPVTVTRPAGADSIVEDRAYPLDFRHAFTGTSDQEDWGTDEAAAQNFELLSGDGGIVWVSCTEATDTGVSVLKVFPRLIDGEIEVGEPHLGSTAVCFKVLGPTGYVKLRIPSVFSIQGDEGGRGTGHDVNATVRNVESGDERTKLVEADENEQFGHTDSTCDQSDPDYPEICSETLLELRVAGTDGGTE
jgi:hypothetical protein